MTLWFDVKHLISLVTFFSLTLLTSLQVKIGDRVVANGTLSGVLRFYGTVQFSHGVWAGIELDEPGRSAERLIASQTCFYFYKSSAFYPQLSLS